MQSKISISEATLNKYLSDTSLSVFVYDSLVSTNDKAKELAANGVREALVVALHQTGGRGRRGRSFFSPDGCGIYMSILLRPDEGSELTALLTSAAAVAVSDAIEEITGIKNDIKWINDIYVGGKKACGILCESSFSTDTGKPEYSIVGIGINLISPEGFPDELQSIATSLFEKELPDAKLSTKLCAEISKKVLGYAKSISKRAFLDKYRKKLSIVLGKEVAVHSPNGIYAAVAYDIDEDCHLIVTLPDGTKKVLSSGEISIRI